MRRKQDSRGSQWPTSHTQHFILQKLKTKCQEREPVAEPRAGRQQAWAGAGWTPVFLPTPFSAQAADPASFPRSFR